jgi:tripartite-type tricarboxylate transporter receptor subunit TctC
VQGFDINISFGLYAPKGTPKPVLDQLSAALQKAVTDPEVRQRLHPWLLFRQWQE